ncbi:WW/Rsp5/WWP [Penicillium argentinense]|uniref:WW/Rsp5/WWP n=1 Tax=Penicillium argentinense TaxID=1131581 RepID=A0A9W9KAD7_9EURO|nr:WW/Rsp5/WWP [Penicillium argentinense]KAJ5098910.1 WW/Rsp5/WWP [Penicillium argentinense]
MDVNQPPPGAHLGPPLWQEARNAEGRPYYYNRQTNAVQWTKPRELMTPAEVELDNLPWKEYTSDKGKKYWANMETKESTWDMPDVYKAALAQVEAQAKAQVAPAPPVAAPAFVAGGTSSYPTPEARHRARDDHGRGHHDRGYHDRYHDRGHHDRGHHDRGYNDRRGYGASETGAMVGEPAVDTEVPTFSSAEEAEAAFMKMLKRHGVKPDWTWEQTLQEICEEPLFFALKRPLDRRNAWEKFEADARAHAQEREQERFTKLRSNFATMLKRHPEIQYFSRWRTIRPIIEGETAFRATDNEDERRQLFEEYTSDLWKAHEEKEASMRDEGMKVLANQLKSLVKSPPFPDWKAVPAWAVGQELIASDEKLQNDLSFKSLHKCDILTTWENHIDTLEREFNKARQEHKERKLIKESAHREAFCELLEELRDQGKIHAATHWEDIFPLIEKDFRFLDVLGQKRKPLDFFWDLIIEENEKLRADRHKVDDAIHVSFHHMDTAILVCQQAAQDTRFDVTPTTTYDEFSSAMATHPKASQVSPEILGYIFQRLQEKAARRSEEKGATNQQDAIDALRYRLRRLNPHVRSTDTWEMVRPRLEQYDEYKALESDELRLKAFEKFIRQQKETEDDAEKDHDSRHRDRHRRDYDRGDRDYRSGRGERRGGRGASRTPEQDVYEAERRKADRERSSRNFSGSSPHSGRRDDRYSDRDRDRRSRRGGDESERERLYRTRGDPRGSRDELDYGGESTASTDRRRRRGSDATSIASRSAKRPRRESAEPERDERKEEKAVHSGSEEGEIEEE